MTTKLKFGIPDLELHCASGTPINPSDFAGHALIATFLPDESEAAARELRFLRKSCADFADYDGWIIAFSKDGQPAVGDTTARILTIADPDRRAWAAFRDLTDSPEAIECGGGATFLFTRGGNLQRYWHGTGHVQDIVSTLRSPACEMDHSTQTGNSSR